MATKKEATKKGDKKEVKKDGKNLPPWMEKGKGKDKAKKTKKAKK
jgi:hypothetical protein